MSFYRVSLLDNEGVVADSRTAGTLADTARLMVSLGECIGEPWTEPLLDADGELTIRVKGAGDRELSELEKNGLRALLEELGATDRGDDADGSRWEITAPETGS